MKRFACLSVLLLASAPVAAEPIIATAPRGEPVSVRVNVSDLNFDSPRGLARLDSRLRYAARFVCDVRLGHESLLHKSATTRCFRSSLENGREAGRQLVAARQAARQSGTVLAAASAIAVTRP